MSDDIMPCGCEGHADYSDLCQFPKLRKVVEAARRLVELECTEGYRYPCEHCAAWDALDVAVKEIPPDVMKLLAEVEG